MDKLKNIAAKLTGKQSHELAIPHGSTILVTGASGYIGSHVVNEALEAGYKVRGTARSAEKCEATKKIFKNHPDYSTAIVADFQHAGAFDEAAQGVDAVIHVASDTTFNPNPNEVVTSVVDGTISILRSAAKSPSVKRFVLTSSSAAVLFPSYDKEIKVSADDWNQAALDIAWAPPPYTEDRAFPVYAASKVEGEKALWKFVKEEKPPFVVNAVLPNFNMGRILSSPGATGGGVPDLLKGTVPFIPAQWMIDVIDDARIHLIAAIDPDIKNERIFAFNRTFTWTEVIAILKKLYPSAISMPQPPENEKPDLSKIPNERGAELLRKWYDQETGYKPMEQTIKENMEGVPL